MIEKSHAVIDGHRIAYLRAGTGPAVVLLHGIGGNATQWRSQLEGLAGELSLIAWDTPGYGDSADPDGDCRMADYAEVLAQLLDHLQLDRAHLIGQSWGGVLAQEFMRKHAARVRSLVLSDTFPGDACRPEAERNASLQGRLKALETMTPAKMATSRVSMLVPDGTSQAIKDEIEAMLAMIRPSGYRQAAIALHNSDERDVLSTIDVPTLVIAGEHDHVVPLHLSQLLANGIPNARLEIIRGTGHLSNQEQPDVWNAVVRGFLGGVG